jgi:hypothetical protein
MPGMYGVVLLCLLLGAEQAETPRVSTMSTLMEERNKGVGKDNSSGLYSNLYARFRIEGAKNVRSYGNVKVTQAKTDTGEDLIRRPKDPKAVFGITDVPGFKAVYDYQTKTGMIDVEIILRAAPRSAKKFKLKGTVEVLVGGEPTNIDIPDILAKEDKEVLKDEPFTAAGLKIIVVKGRRGKAGHTVAYEVEGNNSIVKEINVVDGSGKLILTGNTWYSTRTGGQSHVRTSSQKLPKDAKLRVTIFKGAKISKLPFGFDNIELP